MLLLVAVLFDAASEAFAQARKPLPAVRGAMAPPAGYPAAQALLLLDESDLFSQGLQVTLYFRDDADFELLIGIGFVPVIQSNGYVQILLTRLVGPHEETVRKIVDNDKRILSRISVKPSVSSFLPPRAEWSGDA